MTTAVETAQRADRFPGGRVVAGGFIILAVSSGLGFYGLAVYLAAFSNERGWPVASISLATTLYFIVGGLAGLLVARMIARRDVRIPIVIGGILGGLSLAVLGHVEERWQLYLVYAVFAFGFAGAGLIPVTTVVTRWYHARRSVARGLNQYTHWLTVPLALLHGYAQGVLFSNQPSPSGGMLLEGFGLFNPETFFVDRGDPALDDGGNDALGLDRRIDHRERHRQRHLDHHLRRHRRHLAGSGGSLLTGGTLTAT